MSFSKARIQRFNEFENDVPPPGSYDPKFDVKIKGLVIEKTGRFQDSKSVASAECNLSVSSKSTGNPVTSFRTPQLPRKRVIVKPGNVSCPKVKPRSLIRSNDRKLKYESEHQLADLQVECINKDKTIQEHERHIEDMKEEIRELEMQLEELRKKQMEVEEQHRRDIETMAKLQQEVLNNHDDKHQAETEMLRCQLLEVSEEKEREIQERKTMEGDLRSRLAEFTKKVAALETELFDAKKSSEDKIDTLEMQIEELTAMQEKLRDDHRLEIILLEKEKSQLDSYVNELTDERSELETKLEKRQNVILELQAQLSALQCELDELKAEYEKLVEDSAKQMSDLVNDHEKEIDKLRTDFEEEKEAALQKRELEFEEANSFLKEELRDVQRLYKDLSNRLRKAHEELEESDKKHNLVVQKHREDMEEIRKQHNVEKSELKQLLEDAKISYLKELANVTLARDKEIAELKEASAKRIEEETRRIKEHADKIVENAEAVTRETLAACRAESEERVKKVIAESDAKVNAMIREARAAVEEEMRLTAERYKACLARVEVERAALDEKLAQRDAEINRLSMTLEELKSSAETQESFGQSLQMELDRAETELAEKKNELRALKDQIRAEAAEMVARRKRFEVVMAENQASVAALTKRLAQSTAEVERLQHELKRGEDCIHEHRDLLSLMRNNSQMVHEQVHALMEQWDAKKGLVDQLEADSLKELNSIKSVFEAKIDNFKQIAAKEIARLQADYDTKNTQNIEMKGQLREMADRLKEAQEMLLKLEERNDAQTVEISRVELLNIKLEEQLEAVKLSVEESNELLQSQSAKHKMTLDKANSTIQELFDKIKKLEEREKKLIEDKSELMEEERKKWKKLDDFEKTIIAELEEERARREAAEEEIKKLKEHNDRLVKDYEEISEKYAEVVGHQNHRQRIKHVSQLKDKINQLEQELHMKSRIMEQQQKTIEKLRAEERRAHSKGKENILGLPKSAHSTPVSSPHKPLTPLRSRND